ncbi:hypothetical protein KIN20_028579 [Parelaphostrongylus tenuis]|uniref:Uncharacterized protein n=1 Tax=Parelaphostrongylus tenuis TaxID=148309 RepID=A0AAD5R107_PARTN|nr:hypothetical protein KIN20_028579 [Parelaphostrongylus tenuis]
MDEALVRLQCGIRRFAYYSILEDVRYSLRMERVQDLEYNLIKPNKHEFIQILQCVRSPVMSGEPNGCLWS